MTSTDTLLDTVRDSARAENAAVAATSAAMARFVCARRSDAIASGASLAVAEHVVEVAMDEVAVATEASLGSVQMRVHVAMTLAESLPAVLAAHAEGRTCGRKAELVAKAAWRLVRDESKEALDTASVDYAAGHTPPQLQAWLRRMVARLEPDQVAERRKRALDQRGVWFSYGDDGMATLEAVIPATDALLLERELTIAAKAARQVPSSPSTSSGSGAVGSGSEDPLAEPVEAPSTSSGSGTGDSGNEADGRTLDQARADLLVDRLLARPTVPGGRGAFHVGVTVPLDTLLGLSDEPGTSVDGRLALDPELVRDLTTTPGTLFTRLLTDPTGNVLDVTETGRFPTAALERALLLVDGTCAFPTCTTPAMNTDTDHVEPHPHGPTAGTNLIHLCRRHHRHKTRRLLTTTITDDGQHRWRMPDDTTHDSRTHQRRRMRPPDPDLGRESDAA